MKNFLQRFGTSLILGAGFWLSFIYFPPLMFSGVLFAILAYIIAFEWVRFFSINNLPFWFILPIYPIMPFVILILLNQDPVYHNLLLPLFVIVASHDTGSYLVGTIIGKHKIWPIISPNKSWEGFFGGYLFALAGVFFLIKFEQQKTTSWFNLMELTFAVCVIALIGDMFESWLKRTVGIKNSGDVLPGHGGFLDRFDGIMFAGIFFYLFRDQLIIFFG